MQLISRYIFQPKIVHSWYSIDGSSTTALPIKNPLSHENKNNRQLLEITITLEWEGIFIIATFYDLSIVCQIIWRLVY